MQSTFNAERGDYGREPFGYLPKMPLTTGYTLHYYAPKTPHTYRNQTTFPSTHSSAHPPNRPSNLLTTLIIHPMDNTLAVQGLSYVDEKSVEDFVRLLVCHAYGRNTADALLLLHELHPPAVARTLNRLSLLSHEHDIIQAKLNPLSGVDPGDNCPSDYVKAMFLMGYVPSSLQTVLIDIATIAIRILRHPRGNVSFRATLRNAYEAMFDMMKYYLTHIPYVPTIESIYETFRTRLTLYYSLSFRVTCSTFFGTPAFFSLNEPECFARSSKLRERLIGIATKATMFVCRQPGRLPRHKLSDSLVGSLEDMELMCYMLSAVAHARALVNARGRTLFDILLAECDEKL